MDSCKGLQFVLSLSNILKTNTQFSRGCAIPYLLNVVIAEGPSIFQLLARKDKPLLIRRDAFLVLNLRLHIVDRIARFNLERDCLTREGLDKAGGEYYQLLFRGQRWNAQAYICTVFGRH